MSLTISDVLNRRTDLSTFVVHLTKDTPGSSAKMNLRSILSAGRIEARSAMGWARDEATRLGPSTEATQKVVCFSETPLEHVYSLFAKVEEPKRRVCLTAYGLAFTKMIARRKGVSPVWYVDQTPGREWHEATALDELRAAATTDGERGFLAHPAARLFPFIEQMGTWRYRQKEFWWEREWRHVGDLAFDLAEIALILCPAADIGEFEMVAGDRRCVDPSWSLEQIVAHLGGLADCDVTPFAT